MDSKMKGQSGVEYLTFGIMLFLGSLFILNIFQLSSFNYLGFSDPIKSSITAVIFTALLVAFSKILG